MYGCKVLSKIIWFLGKIAKTNAISIVFHVSAYRSGWTYIEWRNQNDRIFLSKINTLAYHQSSSTTLKSKKYHTMTHALNMLAFLLSLCMIAHTLPACLAVCQARGNLSCEYGGCDEHFPYCIKDEPANFIQGIFAPTVWYCCQNAYDQF